MDSSPQFESNSLPLRHVIGIALIAIGSVILLGLVYGVFAVLTDPQAVNLIHILVPKNEMIKLAQQGDKPFEVTGEFIRIVAYVMVIALFGTVAAVGRAFLWGGIQLMKADTSQKAVAEAAEKIAAAIKRNL